MACVAKSTRRPKAQYIFVCKFVERFEELADKDSNKRLNRLEAQRFRAVFTNEYGPHFTGRKNGTRHEQWPLGRS